MNRVLTSARMVAREVGRNRTAVALLLVVPTVLYGLIELTTGDRVIPFEFGARGGGVRVAAERTLSLLFMGSTAMCGLMAFLAFTLTWRSIHTDRRLAFEGFHSGELLGAKLLVIAGVAAGVAVYVTGLLLAFYQPSRLFGVWVGFFLGGLVYGGIGVAVGALCRRELDGILALLLLVNVDPGWLQNPVFYAGAQHRAVIRWLPSHHACQLTLLSAFTESPLGRELLLGAAWLGAIGLVAAVAYGLRVGLRRRREPAAGSTSRGPAR